MCTFTIDHVPHRLVHMGFIDSGRQGQKPCYMVEKQELDSLGDPRWVRDWEFRDPGASRGNDRNWMLLTLIEHLILAADPKLESAHRTGGWEAVSVILRAGE